MYCCTVVRRRRQNTSTCHPNTRLCCSVLQRVAACYIVLQCVAVWCSMLSKNEHFPSTHPPAPPVKSHPFIMCKCTAAQSTGWQKCIGCLVLMSNFPHTSPTINGSFAERDLQLKASYASSPPCSLMLITTTHLSESKGLVAADVGKKQQQGDMHVLRYVS